VGAAWASFIAIVSYNLFRSVFIWYKIRIHPFTWRTVVIYVLSVSVGAIVWIIPDSQIPIVNILLNGVLVSIFYLPAILIIRLSENVNSIFEKLFTKFKRFIYSTK
jgi:hypothetical protein